MADRPSQSESSSRLPDDGSGKPSPELIRQVAQEMGMVVHIHFHEGSCPAFTIIARVPGRTPTDSNIGASTVIGGDGNLSDFQDVVDPPRHLAAL